MGLNGAAATLFSIFVNDLARDINDLYLGTVIGRLPQLFRATSKYYPSDRDTVYFWTKY
jgi:hypothetical protein